MAADVEPAAEPVQPVEAPAVPAAELPTMEIPVQPAVDRQSVAARREPRRPRRRVVIMASFFAAAALLIGGLGVAVANMTGGDDPVTDLADDPSTEHVKTAATAPADPCPDSVEGDTTTGDGAGDQSSPAGAVLAWNHNYYVTRSAKNAKAVTTENAVATEPELQKAIDAVPAGSTHCVTITDLGKGLLRVKLAVTAPQGQPDLKPQLVQTTRAGGRWWIESIRKDETGASR